MAVYIRFISVEVDFDNVIFDVMDVPAKTNLELIRFGTKCKPFRGRKLGHFERVGSGDFKPMCLDKWGGYSGCWALGSVARCRGVSWPVALEAEFSIACAENARGWTDRCVVGYKVQELFGAVSHVFFVFIIFLFCGLVNS